MELKNDLSDERARAIRDLVRKAGEKDKDYTVFGSSSHKYQLNPVVSLKKVQEFEEKHHIHLPEEYVFFLTKVGNGGAGPYYGLYSLESLDVPYEDLDHAENIENSPAWIDGIHTAEDWARIMDEENPNEDEWEQVYSGILVIGTQGCTYDHLLMCKGPKFGKIVYIDWNLLPENPPFITEMSFLEWYERFFQEILADHRLGSYGYYSLKDEKELMEDYKNASCLDEKSRALKGFIKFKTVSEESLDFLEEIEDKEIDDLRLLLLFHFDEKRAIKLFDDLLQRNPKAAVLTCRRLPEDKRDHYYLTILNFLHCPEFSYNEYSKIIFFLNDCHCKRAKDVVSFASDKNNSEDFRKLVIWLMGKCEDAKDYLDDFICWMKEDALWIAHAALQAVANIPSKKLIPIYEWMWEKYQDDPMMTNNLRIAFQKNGIQKKRD